MIHRTAQFVVRGAAATSGRQQARIPWRPGAWAQRGRMDPAGFRIETGWRVVGADAGECPTPVSPGQQQSALLRLSLALRLPGVEGRCARRRRPVVARAAGVLSSPCGSTEARSWQAPLLCQQSSQAGRAIAPAVFEASLARPGCCSTGGPPVARGEGWRRWRRAAARINQYRAAPRRGRGACAQIRGRWSTADSGRRR